MDQGGGEPVTHVAFLRAINLGSVRKFGKNDVAEATEAAGFEAVRTHLNTGNVGFRTKMRSRSRIERALEAAYLEHVGFEVPTIVLTLDELTQIVIEGGELSRGHTGKHYVSFLKESASVEAGDKLDARARKGEAVLVSGRAVHLMLSEDYRSASVTNAEVEKVCGVATNRTVNVLSTLIDKWSGTDPIG